MPHAVDLNRTHYQQGAGGAEVPSNQPAYVTDEPAFIQTAGAREISEFKARNMNVTHHVFLQRNPGLKLGDRLIARDGILSCPYVGREFAVRSFNECTAGLGLLWEAWCELGKVAS
jgi:hypothetical protein